MAGVAQAQRARLSPVARCSGDADHTVTKTMLITLRYYVLISKLTHNRFHMKTQYKA